MDVSNFEQELRNLYARYTYIRDDEDKLGEVNLDAVQDGLTTILCFFCDRFGGQSSEFDEILDAAMTDAGLK